MEKIINYKIIAARWFKEAEKIKEESVFLSFAGQWICFEILYKKQRGKNFEEKVNELLNSLAKNPKRSSPDIFNYLLNTLSRQVSFFSDRVIKNLKPGGRPKDTRKHIRVLKGETSKREKLKALIMICKLIRNNLVHGDKDVGAWGDVKVVKNALAVMHAVNQELLKHYV